MRPASASESVPTHACVEGKQKRARVQQAPQEAKGKEKEARVRAWLLSRRQWDWTQEVLPAGSPLGDGGW